jgi:hypothetical protein
MLTILTFPRNISVETSGPEVPLWLFEAWLQIDPEEIMRRRAAAARKLGLTDEGLRWFFSNYP